MAVRLKASIGYQPIVEEVSRKFVPRKVVATAGKNVGPVALEDGGWMGGAVSTTFRAGLGTCKRNYLVVRTTGRKSAYSADEKNQQIIFKAAALGRNNIFMDLSQITRVQTMWLEAFNDTTKKVNGVSAKGYTERGWVMAVQYAGRKDDAQYNCNQFPNAFDA